MNQEGFKPNHSGWLFVTGLAVIWVLCQAIPGASGGQLEEGEIEFASPAGVELNIAAIDLSAPIIEITSSDEAAIQNGLRQGVVRLPLSADIGQVGNTYLVGHSSDYSHALGTYKTVFARLPELKVGDMIVVSVPSEQFIYRVIETKIVAADDLSVLSQDTGGEKILTLQTSFPIGSAAQRLVVICQIIP